MARMTRAEAEKIINKKRARGCPTKEISEQLTKARAILGQ